MALKITHPPEYGARFPGSFTKEQRRAARRLINSGACRHELLVSLLVEGERIDHAIVAGLLNVTQVRVRELLRSSCKRIEGDANLKGAALRVVCRNCGKGNWIATGDNPPCARCHKRLFPRKA